MEMQAERQKRRVINLKSQACNKVGVGGWGWEVAYDFHGRYFNASDTEEVVILS